MHLICSSYLYIYNRNDKWYDDKTCGKQLPLVYELFEVVSFSGEQ